jgi:hypothetical protein
MVCDHWIRSRTAGEYAWEEGWVPPDRQHRRRCRSGRGLPGHGRGERLNPRSVERRFPAPAQRRRRIERRVRNRRRRLLSARSGERHVRPDSTWKCSRWRSHTRPSSRQDPRPRSSSSRREEAELPIRARTGSMLKRQSASGTPCLNSTPSLSGSKTAGVSRFAKEHGFLRMSRSPTRWFAPPA